MPIRIRVHDKETAPMKRVSITRVIAFEKNHLRACYQGKEPNLRVLCGSA